MQKLSEQSAYIVFVTKIRQNYINNFCYIDVPKVHTRHVYNGTHVRKLLTVPKLSRLSGNFQECLEIFQTVRKLFTLLETLKTVQKLSRLSGNFPDSPEIFQIVRYIFELIISYVDV